MQPDGTEPPAKAPMVVNVTVNRRKRRATESAPVEPAPSHPLAIALQHPVKVVSMFGAMMAIVLVSLYAAATYFVQHRITIPNVFQAAIAAQQVTVPAAAGWVAVNPERAFEKGAELQLIVTGRVHLAMQQAVAVGRLGDAFHFPPPSDKDCRTASNYLHDLGRWTTPWRTVDSPASHGNDACRLSPKQDGGRLVYVVLKDKPDPKRLGLNQINYEEVVRKGFLESKTHISLPEGGYMLLTVNDRLNCQDNDSAHANAELLKQYLQEVAHCTADGLSAPASSEKSVSRFYATDDQVIRNASIDDNLGEYFVHIDVE